MVDVVFVMCLYILRCHFVGGGGVLGATACSCGFKLGQPLTAIM